MAASRASGSSKVPEPQMARVEPSAIRLTTSDADEQLLFIVFSSSIAGSQANPGLQESA
ncbi:hypothetical protein D3C72_2388080 [compost metagenome]